MDQTARFQADVSDLAILSNALLADAGDPSRSWLESPPPYVDALPVAVYACDADGVIRWFNHEAITLWGRAPGRRDSEQRFCGSYRLFRLDGEPLAPEQTPMAQVLSRGVAVHDVEAIVERPDGSRLIARVHVEPVFDRQGRLLGAINCFEETTALHQAREVVASSDRRLRALLDALPVAIYTIDAEGMIVSFNPPALALWGTRPVRGSNQWSERWQLRDADGQPLPMALCPVAAAMRELPAVRSDAWLAHADGRLIPVRVQPKPLRDGDGRVSGAVITLTDTSVRRAAERRQRVLLDEVDHRVRNVLATVQSLALQTFGDSERVAPALLDVFSRRLIALSRAHDRLGRAMWRGAELRGLLREMLEMFEPAESGRIVLHGPRVELPPRHALALAMLVHELAANAADHGALSCPDGSLSIDWHLLDGEPRRLALTWLESGGPPVGPPQRSGFGRRLFERSIHDELRGEGSMAFDPGGVRCQWCVPLPPQEP